MKSEQDDSITFDPVIEPSFYRQNSTAPFLLIPSAFLYPSSVTARPGQFSFAPTFSAPTAPSSPATLSHSVIVPPVPPQSKPAIVLPLEEVAGVDGLVRVSVSFSLFELSQVEKREIRVLYCQFFHFY